MIVLAERPILMDHQHHVWCKPGDQCWPVTFEGNHEHGPFCGHFTSSSVRWWLTWIKRHYSRVDLDDYGHFDVLLKMIHGTSTANEAELLEHCFSRVVNQGARSSSGLWCVCLTEDAPATVDGRGHPGGDGKSSLTSIRADLEEAADLSLPISWSTTRAVYEIQGRGDVYRARYTEYRHSRHASELDRWLEPRDPETGRPQSRALSNALMSYKLGGYKTTCAWPRTLREVSRAA